MNAIKNSRRFCKGCNLETKFERNTTVWGLGDFIMIFPTFGGWLLIRFAWDAIRNPWRCATCGSTVPLAMPTELPPSGQLYAGFLVLVFGVLGLRALSGDGCSHSSSTAPPLAAPATLPTNAAPTQAAAVVDAGTTSGSVQYQFTASAAKFDHSQLVECADVAIRALRPEDAGADWQPMVLAYATTLGDAAFKDAKELKRLNKTCAEQFADRTLLATCSAIDLSKSKVLLNAAKGKDAGAFGINGPVTLTSAYYDFADVGIDDDRMSECLQMKGEWKALSQDSQAFKEAKLDYHRKKLQKAVDKLNP